MVARRPFLYLSHTMSSTKPRYAGDHKGPLHPSQPPSPLRIIQPYFIKLMLIERDKSGPYIL